MALELEAGIVARDPAMLCAFYTRAMGFAMVEYVEHAAGTVHKLRRDRARLKIFHSVDPIAAVAAVDPWFEPGGWRYAALCVDRFDDVDEFASAVEAARGRVLIAPTNHRDGARMALVCDPEENIWELLAER
jgi:predicted enzyme related to lactoylglutathione lyase